MDPTDVLEHQWPYLLTYLSSAIDLETSARECGAIKRRREVGNAATLLRLALTYGFCGLSLRETAAWAEAASVASLSDVALLKRLRSAAPWLGRVLGAKLAERAGLSVARVCRLRLVDATCVSKPGSVGTDWRLHVSYSVADSSIDHIELTTGKGGEHLTRFTYTSGDIVVGDRGYAHFKGIAAVKEGGAHFIVRFPWVTLPVTEPDGSPLDLLAWLRTLQDASAEDKAVLICNKHGSLPARLVALRKTEAKASEARQKLIRVHKRKQKGIDPGTLEMAGYVCIVTDLDRRQYSASELLELYRFRWQIELAFKRLKSLLYLDDLPAKDDALGRSFIYSKLLAALILEDMTGQYLSFSPWGYPCPATESVDTAAPDD